MQTPRELEHQAVEADLTVLRDQMKATGEMNERWANMNTGTKPFSVDHFKERIKDLEKKLNKNGQCWSYQTYCGKPHPRETPARAEGKETQRRAGGGEGKVANKCDQGEGKERRRNPAAHNNLAELEQGFQTQREVMKQRQEELEKKIKQENESHEQKAAEIDTVLAKEAGQAVASTAVATAKQTFAKSGEQ